MSSNKIIIKVRPARHDDLTDLLEIGDTLSGMLFFFLYVCSYLDF